MKRIVVIFLALCLVSCGKVQKDTLPAEFDAAVNISAVGTEYAAIYEKRAEYDRLVFSAPEHLKGLELILHSGVTTVTMGNTSFESECFNMAFDFLPVTGNEVKNIGNRQYVIEIESAEK
ncbi:MAG: hypothetical protein IJA60_01515 [Clostridia bacterium]|nr:hypothetical protein [Clostridia bacterium]